MRKTFRVIVDVDDVLASCNEAALSRLSDETGVHYCIRDITKWGKMNNPLDERLRYFSDPVFMGSIPLMPGAQDFIRSLNKMAEVFIATSVEPQCAGERISWIVRNFPEIPIENIIIGSRKDLLIADMMLDDGIHNLEKAQVRYPVLFRRPWNEFATGLLSVPNYEDFLNLVSLIKTNEYQIDEEAEAVVLVGPSGTGKKELCDHLTRTGKCRRVETYTTAHKEKYHVLTKKEFLDKMDKGFFFETSTYLGDYYGISQKDVYGLKKTGYLPLLVLDISGAIALKRHMKTFTVFVTREKEECIRSILSRQVAMEEKVQRLSSLDSEFANEEFCDMTFHYGVDDIKTLERRIA